MKKKLTKKINLALFYSNYDPDYDILRGYLTIYRDWKLFHAGK